MPVAAAAAAAASSAVRLLSAAWRRSAVSAGACVTSSRAAIAREKGVALFGEGVSEMPRWSRSARHTPSLRSRFDAAARRRPIHASPPMVAAGARLRRRARVEEGRVELPPGGGGVKERELEPADLGPGAGDGVAVGGGRAQQQQQQAAVDLEAPIKAVPAEGHEHCRVAQPERQRQRDERLSRRHRGGSHRDAAGEDPW
mmetsp:Transcript_13047/g.43420  ORF Transcript_13047/g.43420 Transcript_13047/m.43420 type:complete len:200 (-) Transcript_13047:189-788(-)